MSLSEEVLAVIRDEELCLEKVLTSLRTQRERVALSVGDESRRSQQLTAEIVAARKDVDKQLLASDEAVSHGLQKQRRKELDSIDKLLDHPYFAHLVLEEESPSGKKHSEFLLGHYGNIEARIVDWRNAPVAKLFYEYREGEYFCEDIQGREREGTVIVRNKLEMKSGELLGLSCRFGDFVKTPQGWAVKSRSSLAGQTSGERGQGSLPDVLSLITPEQFRAITEDASCAVLIHGIAGSGKTTVAMYRLGWLLHEKNSDLRPEEIAIIVRTPALLSYIRQSLPMMQLGGLPSFRYREWVRTMLTNYGWGLDTPTNPGSSSDRESNRDPLIWRVLQNMTILRTIEESSPPERQPSGRTDLMTIVPQILSQYPKILALDDSGLLDRETLAEAKNRLEHLHSLNVFHPAEAALLLRYAQIHSSLKRKSFRHFFLDEAQDFSAVELATVIAAAEGPQFLTIVGDTAQATRQAGIFPGWDILRRYWKLGPSLSSFVELPVSHRSTLPIVRFAAAIRRITAPTSGRQGKRPLWFHCRSEAEGVTELISWLERVSSSFPGSTPVVLCRRRSDAEYVGSLLRPSFGHAVEVAQNGDIDFSAGVLVAAVDDVKGLEFRFVMLWNISAENYPPGEESQNRLYVGASRAQELLALITWGRYSGHLPSIESPLVRGIDRTLEEEESEADTTDGND